MQYSVRDPYCGILLGREERGRERKKGEGEREGRHTEREFGKDRETGLDIANKMKYIYYIFLLQNHRNIKKNILELKFYINRIFTPENLRVTYCIILLLSKSE